ncbi:putative neuronal acetylcholine receptor subunit alpha-7-like [Apostichopus japonicus]|uniref:Putative neuronal acetylcholine receptor subunit alpha-7-like n=1 Tax=Stichopus japonicus TaxID=307972 RepID=A0A2G8KBH0_STIJA|nr:putative neuronal acetylcholine receptor subunit alpha-7-like [Apostichopus japonicus]
MSILNPMRWTDERLSWNASEFGGEDIVIIFMDEIWTPNVFITNVLDSDSLSIISPERGSILLTSDGSVSLGTPLVVATQCPIKIYYFPFDTQVCQFVFFPKNQHTEKMIYNSKLPPSFEALQSTDWTFLNITSHNYTFQLPDFATNLPLANVSVSVICLILERNPAYYIKTLMVPSTLLCIMAFVTFVAPPDSGERISLSVSMVLGLTVFQLLVADILPATNEQSPILSGYLTSTFVLACATVPFSLVNINIAYGDSAILALKYRWSRKLFLDYLPRLTSVPTYSDRIRTLHEETAQTNLAVSSPNGNDEGVSFASLEKLVSRSEKTKIEARTVALVMDRLIGTIFSIAFLVLVIKTIIDFTGNQGPPSDICESAWCDLFNYCHTCINFQHQYLNKN